MARYQRQPSGPNLSNGMIWVLGICGVAYMVYKIVSCNQAIKAASEHEVKQINSDKAQEIKTYDSTNKIDSL